MELTEQVMELTEQLIWQRPLPAFWFTLLPFLPKGALSEFSTSGQMRRSCDDEQLTTKIEGNFSKDLKGMFMLKKN